MLKAKVYVSLKQGVLDPQGSAVKSSLHALGFDEVEDVRVGKLLELTLANTQPQEAEARLKSICDTLLANPVIEDYQVSLEEALE